MNKNIIVNINFENQNIIHIQKSIYLYLLIIHHSLKMSQNNIGIDGMNITIVFKKCIM